MRHQREEKRGVGAGTGGGEGRAAHVVRPGPCGGGRVWERLHWGATAGLAQRDVCQPPTALLPLTVVETKEGSPPPLL